MGCTGKSLCLLTMLERAEIKESVGNSCILWPGPHGMTGDIKTVPTKITPGKEKWVYLHHGSSYLVIWLLLQPSLIYLFLTIANQDLIYYQINLKENFRALQHLVLSSTGKPQHYLLLILLPQIFFLLEMPILLHTLQNSRNKTLLGFSRLFPSCAHNSISQYW